MTKIRIPLALLIITLFLACKNRENNLDSRSDTASPQQTPDSDVQGEKSSFQKTLSLHGISFEVSTMGDGSVRQLTIQPTGLKSGDTPYRAEIDGSVADAEIEDLNADGYPELLIYTISAGSGSYGNVVGFSVLGGQSMVPISFPDISGSAEASKGYMGHDVFAIVEATLTRNFPIYREGDPNSGPTGGTRQIAYKMEAGENSPVFTIRNISDY